MLLCSKKCIKNLSRTSCTFIQILNCNIVLMMGSAAKIKIWKYSQRIKKNKTKQDKKTSGSVGPKFFWLTWALRSSQQSYSKYQKYSFDITEKNNLTCLTFACLWWWAVEGRRGIQNILNLSCNCKFTAYKTRIQGVSFSCNESATSTILHLFSLNEFHGTIGQSHLLPIVLATNCIAAGSCQRRAHCHTAVTVAIKQTAG